MHVHMGMPVSHSRLSPFPLDSLISQGIRVLFRLIQSRLAAVPAWLRKVASNDIFTPFDSSPSLHASREARCRRKEERARFPLSNEPRMARSRAKKSSANRLEAAWKMNDVDFEHSKTPLLYLENHQHDFYSGILSQLSPAMTQSRDDASEAIIS